MSSPAQSKSQDVEAQVRSGLAKGRAVWLVVKLVLVAGAVLMFAFDDTPMRPYLMTTAVVMGAILVAWPWLKSRLG
ncbi:MAG: hypothetical protein R2862_06300 [Thermoanaerobaculia bacterium]